MLLPILGIALIVGLFWAREQTRETQKDPVVRAQDQIEKSFGMKLETQTNGGNGLEVLAVRPGSTADSGGIKVGDHVVAVGERSVWHTYGFTEVISKQLKDAPVLPVLVDHNGDYHQVVFASRKAMAGRGAVGRGGRTTREPGASSAMPGSP